MDHEHRTKAAQQQDPEWAARVVRNLAQIELDWYHAYDYLSNRMMTEANLSIEKVVKAPWKIVENEWSTQIVADNWSMARRLGTTIGDMWLQINEISADEDGYEHTWLASVTRTVPSMLCVELVFRRGLIDHSRAFIRDSKVLASLKGFARDEDSATLLIPIVVQAEALAKGFIESDLTPAVAPFARAVEQAIAAKPALDALLDQVRAAAKSK